MTATSDLMPILLAEDETMLRAIAVEMLEEAGFRVFAAADGAQALELLKANPGIRLLVSDVKMPRMDGYALAEEGLALRPGLKVVLMTGYSQEPPERLMKGRGIQILRKPFNLEKLCAIAAELAA